MLRIIGSFHAPRATYMLRAHDMLDAATFHVTKVRLSLAEYRVTRAIIWRRRRHDELPRRLFADDEHVCIIQHTAPKILYDIYHYSPTFADAPRDVDVDVRCREDNMLSICMPMSVRAELATPSSSFRAASPAISSITQQPATLSRLLRATPRVCHHRAMHCRRAIVAAMPYATTRDCC